MDIFYVVAQCLLLTNFTAWYPDVNTAVSFDICTGITSLLRCSSWCFLRRYTLGFKFSKTKEQCCCTRSWRNGQISSTDDWSATVCLYNSALTSNIGSRCRRNSECSGLMNLCYKRKCLCVPGYHYNPGGNKCVRHCRNYGKTMTPYPELAIKDNNIEVGYAPNVSSVLEYCEERCATVTAYQCLSADTRENECFLSKVGYMDVPKMFRETGEKTWTLLMRDCA